MVYKILPDSGGSGGGIPHNSGGGTNNAANAALVPVSGGLTGSTGLVVIPGQDSSGAGLVLQYDPTNNFNTEADSVVKFRIEETEGSQVTIKRLRIKYRNLGKCNLNVQFFGMFSASKLVSVVLGNTNSRNGTRLPISATSDGRIYNAYVDLVFTDESPQLVITRPANGGPLSIISVTLLGDIIKNEDYE